MADSDFLSYSSVYDTFSKGPKSIYYGIGDEMLPGAILNVPQTDEDDEWGRTQRITDERTYDFISKIYKTLFDPYNSLSDISLVPGEAGSEINVAKNMIRLVGRSGIDTGVFDLTVPSLTLGDVVIDGSGNKILIGSGFEATETALKLNTYLEIDGATEQGSITFKNISTNWYDYSGEKKFTIVVDGKEYFYGVEPGSGDPMYKLPVGGVLHVQGTSKVNAIVPNANEAYDIGTTALKFKAVYAKDVVTSSTTSETILASFLYPLTSGGVTEIGRNNNTDIIRIRAKALSVFNVDNSLTVLNIYNNTSFNILDLGDAAGNYVVNIRASNNGTGAGEGGFNIFNPTSPTAPAFSVTGNHIYFGRNVLPGSDDTYNLGAYLCGFRNFYTSKVFSGTGSFSDLLTTAGVLPSADGTHDIGSDAYKYKYIYTRYAYSHLGLYSDSTTTWYLCGPNMKIRVNGETKIGVCNAYIEMYDPMYTRSIYPIQDSGTYLGRIDRGFEALYLIDQATSLTRRVQVRDGAIQVL